MVSGANCLRAVFLLLPLILPLRACPKCFNWIFQLLALEILFDGKCNEGIIISTCVVKTELTNVRWDSCRNRFEMLRSLCCLRGKALSACSLMCVVLMLSEGSVWQRVCSMNYFTVSIRDSALIHSTTSKSLGKRLNIYDWAFMDIWFSKCCSKQICTTVCSLSFSFICFLWLSLTTTAQNDVMHCLIYYIMEQLTVLTSRHM